MERAGGGGGGVGGVEMGVAMPSLGGLIKGRREWKGRVGGDGGGVGGVGWVGGVGVGVVGNGGEGGIRTRVPGFPDHLISSQRRYDRFGTSPEV